MRGREVSSTEGAGEAVVARGVHARRGRTEALRGVDLRIPAGAVCVLAGPNGAGKTTLLRTMLNLTRARGGELSVLGLIPARDGPRLRARIGWMPDGAEPPPGPTIESVLTYTGWFRPGLDRPYALGLLKRFGFAPEAGTLGLSRGEWRRLGLVLALAHRPELLLLDEPFDGLDPQARDTAIRVLADQLAETGATAILATHHPAEVAGLVDHVIVLRDGRTVADAPAARLHATVRRYRFRVPDDWAASRPSVPVLHREGAGRERAWVIAGEPAECRAWLGGSGAALTEERALNLEETVRLLLSEPEENR
jgi:ABC-2 type transport system ATP-binding protein